MPGLKFELSYCGKALLKKLGEALEEAGCDCEKVLIADSIHSIVAGLESGYQAIGHRAMHSETNDDMAEIQSILNDIMAKHNKPTPEDNGDYDDACDVDDLVNDDEARRNVPTMGQVATAVQMALKPSDVMTAEDIINKAG